jgi:hypothetical protein
MAEYKNAIEIIVINIHVDRPVCGAGRGKFFIDKRILFVIVTPHHDLSGRNSVVECHLAKVDVDGSNPFARSIFLSERRHSQVAKAAVCKTVIPRFKSGCRLQTAKGAAIFRLPLFRARLWWKQGDHRATIPVQGHIVNQQLGEKHEDPHQERQFGGACNRSGGRDPL